MCTGKTFLKEAYHALFQNDFQKAIEAFKKAIRQEPKNPLYYYKLSITYARNGDITLALEAANQAYELEPENQNYRYHLQTLQSKYIVYTAFNLMKKHLLTYELEKMLTRAKELDPLNVEAYLLLGIYYGESYQLTKAVKEFNKVLQLDPFHQNAKTLLEHYIKKYPR